MSKSDNIEFTKVTMNVPKKLLKKFNVVAELNHYSRVEATKEAMRQFIDDRTPEGYAEPEDIKQYWRGLMDAMAEVSADPKYQALSPEQQQIITQTAPQIALDSQNFTKKEK